MMDKNDENNFIIENAHNMPSLKDTMPTEEELDMVGEIKWLEAELEKYRTQNAEYYRLLKLAHGGLLQARDHTVFENPLNTQIETALRSAEQQTGGG